ncbi:MAG TPA: hypothetical protein VF643_15535 [Sphingomonas sp.]|jgi:hypothetical protein
MVASAHSDVMPALRRLPRLNVAAIDAIGTVLALVGRMLPTATRGFAHLIASAAMLIIGMVLARLPQGLRPWRATARTPAAHHRWLVASPARWAAP